MDPFNDVIRLLQPHAVFSKPISGRGDWGVRYDAYGLPGFALVLRGSCHLALEGTEPLCLEQGDFVLLPATPAFSMLSRPGILPVPVDPVYQPVRHGEQDGEPDVEMLGGTFSIDTINAPLLLSLLPRMIHVRPTDGRAGRLSHLVTMIVEECGREDPGRDTVLARLLDVMLVECLRAPGTGRDALPSGLLAGLGDPALAGVLRAMHADVRAGWTVAELASRAGMSRSAFAARFTERLGCAPMEYLARWRMALAQHALVRGGKSLDRLAEEIGYESASAFSTAFRRRIGCPPGAFARTRQQTLAAAG